MTDLTRELQREKLACRAGCSHCCYLRVEAYDFEVDSIVQYVNTRIGSKTRIQIIEDLQQQFEVISKLTTNEHLYTNVKCPLLLNGKCAVYPVRPVACAAYHSMNEQECKRSYNDPYDDSFGISTSPDIEYVKIGLHNFIRTGLRSGVPSELISQLYSKLHN
ncbi:YkgJ family cysteine cluster protein [Enterobacter hormaechei]